MINGLSETGKGRAFAGSGKGGVGRDWQCGAEGQAEKYNGYEEVSQSSLKGWHNAVLMYDDAMVVTSKIR